MLIIEISFLKTKYTNLFVKLTGIGTRIRGNTLLRPWQTRTNCCGHIIAHDVSWAAQTGKHLLRTQNASEQNQKHFLCPGHKICVRNKCCARGQTPGETFVSATMCPQQCVLVCQGLIYITIQDNDLLFSNKGFQYLFTNFG